MPIDSVALYEVALPLRHAFRTSSHEKSGLRHLLVALTDEAGRTGWGEIATPEAPYYGAETTASAWEIARAHLAPLVLGTPADDPEQVEALWSRVRGNEFARAGFSIAAWDLAAQRRGCSLAALLGGEHATVAAGVSLGIEPSVAALLDQVAAHRETGYRRVKLKIAPGWDLDPVRAVREAHPMLDLHVDANGAYPEDTDSASVMSGLDELGLTMIEQPYAPRDLLAHARLQARLHTPVCLDESVVTLADLEAMIALDAGRVLNIKVSRMGGLGPARAAHDLARAAGIPVWCGGMHEFGIGRAANVALSALPGFTLPSDVSGSDKYYERDLISPPVTARDGLVSVPTSVGLGHEVDADRIRTLSLRTLELHRSEAERVGS